MLYYKKIKIRDLETIQRKVNTYIDQQNWFKHGFHKFDLNTILKACPELRTCLSDYGLFPVYVATYITHKQEWSQVHRDYDDPKGHWCRVNIPIRNCRGSATEFYSRGGTYTEVKQPNSDVVQFLLCTSMEGVEKVAEVEIVEPTVIRVQEPHRVRINPDRVPRVCLTLHCNKDPVFLLD